MPNFNPFRVSFDRPLAPGEHRQARVGALAVCGVALVVGAASFLTAMNASSGKIAVWSNARLLADDMDSKPCSEQKWPYIQARCRTAPVSQEGTTGSAPADESVDQAAPDQDANPQSSQRPQNPRDEQIRLQRERRQEAVRARQQRIDARNGGRRVARDERAGRRGDEPAPGGNQRVVIQRGAFEDGLFGLFR